MTETAGVDAVLTGFTAHNVLLGDGTETLPGAPILAQTPIARSATGLAQVICPPSSAARRVVDLGCLEGGYAVEFARAGFEVLGIEARAENVRRCNYVGQKTGLPNLSFVRDDVRHLAQYGEFDVTFCCGLLYHLEKPVAFLHQIGRSTRRLLILHTHYAERRRNPNFWLGALTEHEGVRGRWMREVRRTGPQRAMDKTFGRWYRRPYGTDWPSEEEMEARSWAAWGNTASFWMLKDDLLQSIRAAGFEWVAEVPGADETAVEGWRSRSMFLGVKA